MSLAATLPTFIRLISVQVPASAGRTFQWRSLVASRAPRASSLHSAFGLWTAPWGASISGASPALRSLHAGTHSNWRPLISFHPSSNNTRLARTARSDTPRFLLTQCSPKSLLTNQLEKRLCGRQEVRSGHQRLFPQFFHSSGASSAPAPPPPGRGGCATMGLPASLLTFFAIDLGIQVAGWAYSYWQQTDKFYDLTGSLTYLTLAGLSLSRSALAPHQLLVSAMVALWAARLGSFLFARVLHAGKDDRLDRVKSQPGTFLLYWTVQAVWVFVVSLPMLLLNASPAAPLGPVAYLGAGIWAAGFAMEAVADHQKDRFRRDRDNQGKWIDSGLWRYSRHPNYFGEITLWTGAAICAASALPPPLAAACCLSPLLSYHLTINVSGLPMVEKSAARRWGKDPAYQAYLRDTSAVIPWFRKENGS